MSNNTSRAVKDGLLIESGWQSLKQKVLQDAPEMQVIEMRKALFAGASFLFFAMMEALDANDDGEPTESDMQLMELIQSEIAAHQMSLAFGREAVN